MYRITSHSKISPRFSWNSQHTVSSSSVRIELLSPQKWKNQLESIFQTQDIPNSMRHRDSAWFCPAGHRRHDSITVAQNWVSLSNIITQRRNGVEQERHRKLIAGQKEERANRQDSKLWDYQRTLQIRGEIWSTHVGKMLGILSTTKCFIIS